MPEKQRYQYIPPPNTSLKILYEDAHLLAAEKPHGLLSVPGKGDDRSDSMHSRLCEQTGRSLHVIHRLDMFTSGLMLFAKDAESHKRMNKQFAERLVDKSYVAYVGGRIVDCGHIDRPLIVDWPNRPRQMICTERGKPSLTYYNRLSYDRLRNVSKVALHPITGRSHQLRVHMQSLGHPIVGDQMYADDRVSLQVNRMMLHALSLVFVHPFKMQYTSIFAPESLQENLL